MRKKNPFKIILGTAAVIILVAGIFWLRKVSPTRQKEIVVNNSETKDDILSDSQMESDSGTVVSEPKEPEAETGKEPAPAVEVPQEQSSDSLKITDKLLTSGFEKSSGRTIDTIIIHSSYDAIGADPYSVSGVINEYRTYGVSAHYLISRDGTIYRLVKENDIAYHAGVSRIPDGRTNVNDFSIGIELINTKDGKFTENQYAALNDLIDYLKAKYKIKYVLGHNQIAPGRKDDPWNFNWEKIKK